MFKMFKYLTKFEPKISIKKTMFFLDFWLHYDIFMRIEKPSFKVQFCSIL